MVVLRKDRGRFRMSAGAGVLTDGIGRANCTGMDGAVHEGLDAVAWTRGAHQLIRYKGLGAAGLIELYDRTLPL